jgi:hypothetical protein
MKNLPVLFSILDNLKYPTLKTGVFNPKWEKEYFMEKATHKTGGLDQWGDPGFISGLEALLDSIKKLPSTHFIGQITLHSLILRSLVNRLRYIDLLNRDVDNNLTLNNPIFITGLSRSGTTYLQRLMSFDQRHYAFPLWELLDPYKNAGTLDFRRSKSNLEIYLKNVLIPELDKKHYTRADTKEECILLLANSFHSQLFTDIAPLAEYLDWYLNSNREYAYKEYRDQLKVLQSYHPGKRFVLKAPSHLGSLNNIVKYFPNAKIIQTHRNPDECISSLSSLRQSLFKMVEGEIDNDEIQKLVMQLFDSETKKNVDFHQEYPDRVISVSYKKLTANPLSTLKNIYGKMEYDWTDQMDKSVKQYIKENPQNRRGKHKYNNDLQNVVLPQNIKAYGEYFNEFL